MGTVYINNVVKQMKTDLRLIQEQQPLIHNITNYVAMNFVANSLLAIGASPIMARAEEEVEEISSKSNALALNLGVPESTTAHSMILAGEAAMKKRIPIVFDVVGVGATRFRMDIASQIILRCHPTVIKGNASEIQALYSHQIGMQGVDSHQETYEVEKQAKKLAQQLSCIIVVTGAIDFITDGERMAYVHEGHSMMSKVTAMGCTATGIVGAFLAVNSDPLEASFHAMKAMGIAGKRAASQSRGTGITSSTNSAILWLMTRIIKINRRSFMKSFIAINLFGIIVTCEDLSKVELNHELIHTAQARELLYIPFYLWYIIEWFYLYFKYRDWMQAYYNIRFEKEAYAHQEDLEYLNRRKHYCYR